MLIEARELSKTYGMGGGTVTALQSTSFDIAQGEFVAIMGPSGSGKSTLLNLIGCLDTPTSGRYMLEGVDVSHMDDTRLSEIRNRRIGFVFQSFNLLPRLTSLQNVELPLLYQEVPDCAKRAKAALETVGLGDRAKHRPAQLSGGECQRVAIARAIATNPALILADEPTGNLDSQTGQDILKLFLELHRKGSTIILVTHGREVAEDAQRIMHLKDGLVVKTETLIH
jgi:putative ABC transport system ATP-binding protein